LVLGSHLFIFPLNFNQLFNLVVDLLTVLHLSVVVLLLLPLLLHLLLQPTLHLLASIFGIVQEMLVELLFLVALVLLPHPLPHYPPQLARLVIHPRLLFPSPLVVHLLLHQVFLLVLALALALVVVSSLGLFHHLYLYLLPRPLLIALSLRSTVRTWRTDTNHLNLFIPNGCLVGTHIELWEKKMDESRFTVVPHYSFKEDLLLRSLLLIPLSLSTPLSMFPITLSLLHLRLYLVVALDVMVKALLLFKGLIITVLLTKFLLSNTPNLCLILHLINNKAPSSPNASILSCLRKCPKINPQGAEEPLDLS
jgi:hypothetical protein